MKPRPMPVELSAGSAGTAPSNPVVSVCMTTYNHAPYLAQAIEGVLAQRTSFDVELVLSDDCSTDGTAAVCADYAARYPDRIRLVTGASNVGWRANYRRTFEACRGNYVAYCDGDDFWIDPFKLQKQVDLLESDLSCGMCYTRSERRIETTAERWIYPRRGALCDFDGLLFDNTVENCTAVARRELIGRYYAEVRPEEHPQWLTDDAPMWIWFARCSRIRALDCVTAVHRLLPQSVSQSGSPDRRIAFCDSLADISLWFDARYGTGAHAGALHRRRMEVALWVLSRDGSTGAYLSRWWRDVRRTPRLLLDAAGYGLLVKRWLRLLFPKPSKKRIQ